MKHHYTGLQARVSISHAGEHWFREPRHFALWSGRFLHGGCQGAARSIESLGFRAWLSLGCFLLVLASRLCHGRLRRHARLSFSCGSGLKLGFQRSVCSFPCSDGLVRRRCHQLYMAVVPDDVDSDEDAQLRRSRDRGTFCLAILSFVVALISLIATVMPASKENVCDAYLTSLANNVMLPHHYDLPQPYVNRTVLSMELAELVEHSQAPRSQVRLIVVLGRRQVGKTSVIREQFMKKTNVYYHALEARAMQLGSDLDHACGSQHLSKGHIQRIVGKVYEKSRQNITIIFDIPHNAEDADVTRVYEDLKGMVYDDAHRRPVLGVIILSNHYQVDAFPRDKGRFETLWVGDLEESEAREYVGKLQADGSVMTDMGTGLKELAWANRLPRWKEEVEHSVRASRGQSRHAEDIDGDDLRHRVPLASA